jgi:hypothetical protein
VLTWLVKYYGFRFDFESKFWKKINWNWNRNRNERQNRNFGRNQYQNRKFPIAIKYRPFWNISYTSDSQPSWLTWGGVQNVKFCWYCLFLIRKGFRIAELDNIILQNYTSFTKFYFIFFFQGIRLNLICIHFIFWISKSIQLLIKESRSQCQLCLNRFLSLWNVHNTDKIKKHC